MPFSGVMTATVFIACVMTLLMGLYHPRLPFAVAPGMGLNAFFAFTLIIQNQVPWQTALGIVSIWAGALFLLSCRRRRHANTWPWQSLLRSGAPPPAASACS